MPEPIVTLNEESLRGDLRELVRQTVEDTLNGLLEEEADDLVGAERYERTAGREAYRAGHYDRRLATTSGEVTLRMPKLKGMRFTTAIVERYRRRETSVEEAMIEMYLAGVSTRRIEDAGEILWGSSVSASTVSNLNEKAFEAVEVCFVNLSFHKTASVRFTRQREDSSRTSVALAPILSSPTTPRA